MARGLVPRGHLLASRLLATCKQIASTTPQVWLVAGSHLGFAKKSFHSIASDKGVLAMTRSVDKSLAMRLPRRVFYTSRNDKVLRQELRASVCLQNKKEWLVFFCKEKVCRRFEIYFESPFRKKSFKNVGVEFCFLTSNKKIFVLLVCLYAHGIFFGDDYRRVLMEDFFNFLFKIFGVV